jgi:cell division protein ZapA
MGGDESVIQVEIFGQTYNLRADGDPAYVQSLASHVDAKMREVARETKAVDTLRVAILAALNIADESRRAAPAAAAHPKGGKTADAVPADLERRTAEWMKILDEALAG